MSVLTLQVDEVMRTLSNDGQYPFVVNDKTVDIVRFALNTGFTDIVLDEYSALRVMYQRPGETEVRAQTLTYHDTDGLRSYYDWQLLSADLAEKGTLTVALCILRTDSEVEEWHTTPCQVRVLDTIHTDDSDEGDETITPTVAQRVAVLESVIQGMAGGAPVVVDSASDMTDTAQIYVLSTDGMWYYYDGSAWVAGGEYGAVATDTTLTQPGVPADAKAVGDAIKNNKGLSDTAAALLISILGDALYTSDQSDAIQALEEALIEGDIVRVTGITLSSSSKTVEYGSTAQITATVTPANATNRTVIWASSNESVATVSNGTITGVGVGNAIITAKTVDGGFTASCTVSVTVENLLKTEDATTGAYIDRDTGSTMPSDSWTATDYIWLKPNTTYHSEGCFLENFYSFYDENKNHVSSPPSGITIEFGPDRNWGAKRKGTIAMGSQGYYFRGSYNTSIQYTPYIALTPIE